MSENLQTVLNIIPILNDDEIKQIQGLLKIKLGGVVNTEEKTETETDYIPESFLFYSCIQKQFNYILKVRLAPLTVLTKKDKKLINEVYVYLLNYLDELLKGKKLNKGDLKKIRSAFFSMYVVTVINGISRNRKPIPVTLRTVLQWHNQFPGLLDIAYPGYIQNGQLINLVLLQKELNT